jgi:uncharacterized membrane protein YdjX (TVP38/TMEM64 family)
VATVGGILLLALLVVAIDPLRQGVSDAISGDTADLRGDLRGLGVGYVYGFWVGLPLVMLGWIINAVLAYWVGRHAARPLLWRFVGEHRFERLEGMVEAGGTTLLLAMRLIPIIPFSLFSIAAGAARADFRTFVWTTAIGYLPLTAVFVYLGSRLETLSANDPIIWLGALVLVALLVVTHYAHRQWRDGAARSTDQSEPET